MSLNAAAAPGSAFAGWSGACSGTGPCSVTNNAIVTARFIVPISTDRLTVTLGGNGTGTVTSNPSGISCPGTCAADFATGTTVTLTATPTNGSTFNGFSGAGCSGPGSSCTVAMNGDQAVTATFTAVIPIPMSTLSVQKIGSGSGTVTSTNQAGINCGSTCGASFPTNSLVAFDCDSSNRFDLHRLEQWMHRDRLLRRFSDRRSNYRRAIRPRAGHGHVVCEYIRTR